MNIYKLSRKSSGGYGSYTTAIIIAESENDAKLVHPNGAIYPSEEYDDSWVEPDDVVVSLIGTVTVDQFKSTYYNWDTRKTEIKEFPIKSNIVLCAYNVGS